MFAALVVIVVIVGANVRGLQDLMNPTVGGDANIASTDPRVGHFSNIYVTPLPAGIAEDHLSMNEVHHVDNDFIRNYFISYVNQNINSGHLVHTVEGNDFLVSNTIMDHRSRQLFNQSNLSGVFELNTSNHYVFPRSNVFGTSFTLVEVDESREGINLIYRGTINTVPATIRFNLTNHMGNHQVNYFQRISE